MVVGACQGYGVSRVDQPAPHEHRPCLGGREAGEDGQGPERRRRSQDRQPGGDERVLVSFHEQVPGSMQSGREQDEEKDEGGNPYRGYTPNDGWPSGTDRQRVRHLNPEIPAATRD